MARKSLTNAGVKRLKSRAKRYVEPDPELRFHCVRVEPSDSKTYMIIARGPSGKQKWVTIGSSDIITIEEARDLARPIIRQIMTGEYEATAPDTGGAGADTFEGVAANWMRRHVEKEQLRTKYEIQRMLQRYILPRWAGLSFAKIKRSDITKLMDRIEDNHGPGQADNCLSVIKSIMTWYARREDDYIPPIVPGMGRVDKKARRRARVLSDAEIRLVWDAAGKLGTYGNLTKLALLSGQRRDKLVTMRWNDVTADGVWHIPSEVREKGTPSELKLPEMAFQVIRDQQPPLNEFVFAADSDAGHYTAYSYGKALIDAEVAALARERDEEPIPPWRFHDLRRTSRTLLSRAGVRPDVGERVLGHAVGSAVSSTYDRHTYAAEIAKALEMLAGLVDRILDPRDKLVQLELNERS